MQTHFQQVDAQNRARVFPNSESFIFYCNNSTNFETVICMKTVKSKLLKKYLKRIKSRARFCLPLRWLHISEKKKMIENFNSIGVEAHKVGKNSSFWPNFDPRFTNIWRA